MDLDFLPFVRKKGSDFPLIDMVIRLTDLDSPSKSTTHHVRKKSLNFSRAKGGEFRPIPSRCLGKQLKKSKQTNYLKYISPKLNPLEKANSIVSNLFLGFSIN